MKKGLDPEMEEHDDRITFKSDLAHDVQSMLAEFSRDRKDQAEKSRIERKAFIFDIKDQVARLRKSMPKEEEEVLETIIKVSEPAAPTEEPAIDIVPEHSRTAEPEPAMTKTAEPAAPTEEPAIDIAPEHSRTTEPEPAMTKTAEPATIKKTKSIGVKSPVPAIDATAEPTITKTPKPFIVKEAKSATAKKKK